MSKRAKRVGLRVSKRGGYYFIQRYGLIILWTLFPVIVLIFKPSRLRSGVLGIFVFIVSLILCITAPRSPTPPRTSFYNPKIDVNTSVPKQSTMKKIRVVEVTWMDNPDYSRRDVKFVRKRPKLFDE